ncbi:hypothetical protein G3I60_07155 [Streptomyces sp. SID13666]|uniref:hypothetical protein n=1 Tax=unclassified Streptomyces TaxID=2593676 RepID=UPI0013BF6DBE|nr:MULTISPECIES: hypothetical protein [unclassified Streptomyces]MCZ4097450.1 hypothetical protein [Streptomyces sp. H39-C1]NEA53939.1 hypothetical protein [Streptomyces sp. SID13666]
MPFSGRPVLEPIVAEMATVAHAAGARLHVPDIAGQQRMPHLTADAEARHHARLDRTAGTLTWITAPETATRYGILVTALGPPDADARLHRRAAGPPPSRPVL